MVTKLELSGARRLEWTLRIGAFLCFVGHGAFGVITKEAWVPYFGVVGIGRDTALHLMPLIGILDIGMGIIALVRPVSAVFVWMTLWAVWTALLRPLSGEPFFEAVERAGNYGVPAALLLLGGRVPRGKWFAAFRAQKLTPQRLEVLRRVLTLTVALLLGGHGALGVIAKRNLIANYASVLPADVASRMVGPLGWAEIAVAVLLLVVRRPGLALAIAAWKIVTEVLFVTNRAPIWEWIERGGSYAAPIALALVLVYAARPVCVPRPVTTSAS